MSKFNERNFYKEVGRRVTQVRKSRKMTQSALAEHLDLKRTSVTNIENGEQRFMVHTLIEIARALCVTPITLLPERCETPGEDAEAALRDEPEDARRWILNSLEAEMKEAGDGGST